MQDEYNKWNATRDEHDIIDFWKKNDIFFKSQQEKTKKKTLSSLWKKKEFTFIDGPPFANGLPHYGHLLQSVIKDAIPRYQTMRGYIVKRRWGWDCHGLPVENEIEKKLNLNSRADIEKIGIGVFNKASRESVLTYADEWKHFIERIGRFIDIQRSYKTLEASYMEIVWELFSRLHKKGLVYKGMRAGHICGRCGTILANSEVAIGYADVEDIAVYVTLPLVEEDASLIIWTTTPWTLLGNMAAAVNSAIEYVYVKKDGATYIVAEDALERVDLLEGTIQKRVKGSELLGKAYTPPFNYFVNRDIPHKENAWKIYDAPYVNTEAGTGIVHLAPAYGAEDFELAKKKNIPVVHHITINGVIMDFCGPFKGLTLKEAQDPLQADRKITQGLGSALYKEEIITHAYPHCWRCDTRLLNYAQESWFVDVPAYRKKMVAENKKVYWIPKEIGHNRFHNWIAGAREWAVTRSRYWGTPVPIWEKQDGTVVIIDSYLTLKKYMKKPRNRFIIVRHGESINNIKNLWSTKPNKDDIDELTEKGKKQATATGKKLKGMNITKIITSPFNRTKQTAHILADEVGVKNVVEDIRLQEVQHESLHNFSMESFYPRHLADKEMCFSYKELTLEETSSISKRATDLLYDIDAQYENETIVIVTHKAIATAVATTTQGHMPTTHLEIEEYRKQFNSIFSNGAYYEIEFKPFPRNDEGYIDFHKPFIDTLPLYDEEGRPMKRIEGVFDCWFESGSGPYASRRHLYRNRFLPQTIEPVDFIAEAIDQTRGWFYSLMCISVGVFNKRAFKNVISSGHILASDGAKMSKKLKNYTDPKMLLDAYGADAVRYYLLASPVVRGKNFAFDDEGVKEVSRKIIGRLDNCVSFLLLYKKDDTITPTPHTNNILDEWIVHRIYETHTLITSGYDEYKLDQATRPIADIIEDLSVWYLRRSRVRIKEGDKEAIETFYWALCSIMYMIAPAMPFYGEHMHRTLKHPARKESVHLEEWQSTHKADTSLLQHMRTTRATVSDALELRSLAGIKVRQPLASLTIPKDTITNKEYLDIIQEEINVKTIIEGESISLDTVLTDELKEEGLVRDIVRLIQQKRKEHKCNPHDSIQVTIHAPLPLQTVITHNEAEIKQLAHITKIELTKREGTEKLGEHTITIEIHNAT